LTDDATPAGPIVTMPPPAEFAGLVAGLGVEFEPGDVERLGRFLSLLLEANRTTNLTAITEPGEAWRKHILDALTLVPLIASFAAERAGGGSTQEGVSVVDIGSGGGVPALPLAIVMPETRFTLVEATGKKVEFLRRAIGELGLKNARVVQGRAETIGQDHKEHRERYHVGIARALGHLSVVVELLGPLVEPRGVVLAVKGAKADQEVEESRRACGAVGLRHLQTVETPTGRVVVLEKTTRTPRLYPRRDGEPARSPLKG
jgi:16S rRNA (guanine527-N7)-methyltransferase